MSHRFTDYKIFLKFSESVELNRNNLRRRKSKEIKTKTSKLKPLGHTLLLHSDYKSQ